MLGKTTDLKCWQKLIWGPFFIKACYFKGFPNFRDLMIRDNSNEWKQWHNILKM